MKYKKLLVFMITLMVLALVAAQCGQAAPTTETITVIETVIIEKEVEVEIEGETVTVIETVVVEQEVEVEVEVVVTATPEPVDTGPTPVPEGAAPQETEILRIGQGFNLRGCDLHIRGSSTTHQQGCGATVLDTLITLEDKNDFAPSLAESWEISDDGKTYTFHLREGVNFHDGTPFNAEAVKINFERIMDEELNAVFLNTFKNIESIETPDEQTAVVTLVEPDVGFMIALVQYGTGIYSPAALEEHGADIDIYPVGTGPFKIISFEPDHQVFERNDEYWDGAPYAAGVDIKTIPDPLSRVFELETGAVDAIMWVPEAEIARLIEEPTINMQSEPGQNHTGFALNASHPPLDDIRVRQAVLYAINEEEFMAGVWQGRAIVSTTGIPPAAWAFNGELGDPYPYDPDKARALLDEAGWVVGDQGGIRTKDGELLELYFPVGADLPRPQVALIAQAQLRDVGIATDVSVIETFTFYDQVYNCDHDITYWSNSFITLDPAPVYQDFHSVATRHAWCYSNPEVDTLIEQGRALADQEARKEVYGQIQEMIAEDAVVGWLAHYESPSAATRGALQGWNYPLYRIHKLDKSWLAE